MGPLYHFLRQQDRKLAMLEAWRRLKEGGFLFASTITRYAPIRRIAERDPEMITREPENFSEIIDLGISRAGGSGRNLDYHFSLPEELMRMITEAGFTKLEMVGCDGVIASVEEKVIELTGDVWEARVSLNHQLG